MGDALADGVRDCYDLKENDEGDKGCPRCGKTTFAVTLESPVYIVTLSPEDSYPEVDEHGPAITKVVCTSCGYELRVRR